MALALYIIALLLFGLGLVGSLSLDKLMGHAIMPMFIWLPAVAGLVVAIFLAAFGRIVELLERMDQTVSGIHAELTGSDGDDDEEA